MKKPFIVILMLIGLGLWAMHPRTEVLRAWLQQDSFNALKAHPLRRPKIVAIESLPDHRGGVVMIEAEVPGPDGQFGTEKQWVYLMSRPLHAEKPEIPEPPFH